MFCRNCGGQIKVSEAFCKKVWSKVTYGGRKVLKSVNKQKN